MEVTAFGTALIMVSNASRDELCVLRWKQSMIDWSVDGMIEEQRALCEMVSTITQG